MEQNNGISMANTIELVVLLLYCQVGIMRGLLMAKTSPQLLKNGSKTKQFLGHGPMKKRGWSFY